VNIEPRRSRISAAGSRPLHGKVDYLLRQQTGELRLAVAGTGELKCQECPTMWSAAETGRWRVLLSEDDPPKVVLYCPDCASREFGTA
jgi:hypothetical protein